MASVFWFLLLISSVDGVQDEKRPTVMITLLIRNKAHLLPHFFSYLEDLDYPKNRISLFIRSDHNEDETASAVRIWISKNHDYHSIDFDLKSDEGRFPGESNLADVSKLRFKRVMKLKEESFDKARAMRVDYIWFLDADAFISNRETLTLMTSIKNMAVFAPMLRSSGEHSNFWSDMEQDYYYDILFKGMIGCFQVPLVYSSVFVNLNHVKSEKVTFYPSRIDVPFDDTNFFALSAEESFICNEDDYGYFMFPHNQGEDLKDLEEKELTNLKLEMIANLGPLRYHKDLDKFLPDLPPKNNLGYDKVYLINLERRRDRFEKMSNSFDLLGIDYKKVKAVDGKFEINDEYLLKHGIKMMTKFVEPHHKRPIKHGEIGCFLSHYNVWKNVIEEGHDRVIVFEDDIRFEPFFKAKLDSLNEEIKRLDLDWHLIFLGRKILSNQDEPMVADSDMLLHVGYTYWTLGYILSNEGAKILVDEKPLSKIIPVDEYLPIMYDRHPMEEWKSEYNNRTLKAFSVRPLLLYPTHYHGEKGYISDTEDSRVIKSKQTKYEL